MKVKLKQQATWILAASCLFVLMAAALFLAGAIHGSTLMAIMAGLGTVVAGSTVTYTYPVAGTTPPTVTQIANMVIANVNMSTSDTQAILTHNFQESTAEAGDLFPIPIVYADGNSTPTLWPAFTYGLPGGNTNQMSINKAAGNGTAATYVVILLRPHSIIR